MNARPRPSTLESTCGFNRSGRALVHRWNSREFYMVRNTTDGEPLRLEVVRCLRCGAFRIHSLGGDRDVLDELLSFAVTVPEVVGWFSPEQPGHEVCCALPPLPNKRRRRAPARRKRADS